MYDEEDPKHKNPYVNEAPKRLEVGKGFGQWEHEFDGRDLINEIITGGPNSDSLTTASGATETNKVIERKCITLEKANDKVISFDTMKDMVLNNKQ